MRERAVLIGAQLSIVGIGIRRPLHRSLAALPDRRTAPDAALMWEGVLSCQRSWIPSV
jgi:hypothetical protein